MSSINGKEYKEKYGTDHEKAANEQQANKIYTYKSLRSLNLDLTYKLINSDSEEDAFLKSEFISEPKLIWFRSKS